MSVFFFNWYLVVHIGYTFPSKNVYKIKVNNLNCVCVNATSNIGLNSFEGEQIFFIQSVLNKDNETQ